MPQQAGRSTLNQAGGEEAQVSFSYKQPPQGRIKGKMSMERSKKGKEGKRREKRQKGKKERGRTESREKEGIFDKFVFLSFPPVSAYDCAKC